MSIFPFIATVGWLVFIYRLSGWFRHQRKLHRERLIALGYKENNPGRRLREDGYQRIAAIVYLAVGFVAYMWIGEMIPRYAPSGARIVFPVLASIFIPIPAVLFAYLFARLHGEWTAPQGDEFLKARDLKFHIPGQPIVPDGSYGTAAFLNSRREGLVERLGLTPRLEPIVEQDAK